MKKIWIILAIILLIIAINLRPQPNACPMDAQICPDGSFVSRTGPNCEFSQCPAMHLVNSGGDVNFSYGG